IEELEQEFSFHSQKAQAAETIARYQFINQILADTVKIKEKKTADTLTSRLDKILTHKVWGFLIFFAILFFIFQAIFAWSEYPMTLIEELFVLLETLAHQYLPAGVLTDLLVDG